MSDQLATLKAPRDEYQRLLRQASAKWYGPVHDYLLFKITEQKVHLCAQQPGRIRTYCTVSDQYFKSITLENRSPVEAILPVDRVLDGLKIGSSTIVTMELFGDTASQLATRLAMTADISIPPTSLATESGVYWKLTFDPQNYFNEQDCAIFDGNPAETVVKTSTDVLDTLLTDIDKLQDIGYDIDGYPIYVVDDAFKLYFQHPNKGDEVWGQLDTDGVEGPAVYNNYKSVFKKPVKTLSGDIELQISPNKPLAIVQRNRDLVIRHIIRPA